MSEATSDDWRHRAACRGEDPELFFPVGNRGGALLQIEQARAVCNRCGVLEQCLEFALESDQMGVWGGMSEEERRAIRRRGGARVLQFAEITE